MLLGIDVLLLLVVAAGSKRGGGGIEACEGSDGDLITEALTDDVTEGSPPCSDKGSSELRASPFPKVMAGGDKVGGVGVLAIWTQSDSSGISSSHTFSTW